jgi:hypothetical protein
VTTIASACSNCGTTENVAPRSPDLDIRPILLCDICSVALVMDPELFGELRRRKR